MTCCDLRLETVKRARKGWISSWIMTSMAARLIGRWSSASMSSRRSITLGSSSAASSADVGELPPVGHHAGR